MSLKMVRFLRFHGDDRPEVAAAPKGDSHPVLVTVRDYLTWGEELEVPADLVVLAVGVMPRDVDDLVKNLKISRGTDRFLAEVHPKLRPVETAVPGVILAGTAQGPMNIQETVAAASAPGPVWKSANMKTPSRWKPSPWMDEKSGGL